MTARFDRITLIDVADSRMNKVSWKAIGEDMNLTASELKAIRKSTSYRIVAGEVMARVGNFDIDVAKVFGVEEYLANSIIIHAENAKAESEARKTEVEAEMETTEEAVEMTETTKTPTTEELETRLEKIKTRVESLNEAYNEVNEATEAVASNPRREAFKAFSEARQAFETYADSENADYAEIKRLQGVKQDAFKVYRQYL